MKILLKKILMLSISAIVLGACEKDETKSVVTDGTPPLLTASSTTIVLTKANQNNTAITFNVKAADFGVPVAFTTILQLDVKGNNFSKVKEVILQTKEENKTYSVIDFNAILLSMGLPTSANSVIEARIKSELTSKVAPVYSNIVELTVNPYPLISYVYVPGDYQGWNPGAADSLISATSNGIYEGIIKYPASAGATYQFKLTPAKNWNTSYGDAGAGKISTTASNNLSVPGAGTYKLTANFNDMTFTAVPYSFGVIGSATAGGWNNDTDMSYNNGLRVWSITTPLIAGEIKFRLNDAWDVNYGGTNGVLANGGSNIAIASAGNYKIEMNLPANTYTITKL